MSTRSERPRPTRTNAATLTTLAVTSTASPAGQSSTTDLLALASLAVRHTRALAELEKNHNDRLSQLEERLTAAERATTDLGGQIREMR